MDGAWGGLNIMTSGRGRGSGVEGGEGGEREGGREKDTSWEAGSVGLRTHTHTHCLYHTHTHRW
jgi:hypothetical protein